VFHPPQPGKEYTFKTRSDDASYVVVNGKIVVNNKHLHGMVTKTGSVKLDAPAEVKIYFGERGGGAGLKFEWKGGSQRSYTDRLGLFTPGALSIPVPSCKPVTVECGKGCELSGTYQCNGNYNGKPWWVKDGLAYNTPNGEHPEQFQIWFNNGQWRLGYTNTYWYLNDDPSDWRTSKWTPQKGGAPVTVEPN